MPPEQMVFQHSTKPFDHFVGMGIFKEGAHVGFIYKQDDSGSLARCEFTFWGVKTGGFVIEENQLWTPSKLNESNQKFVCTVLNTFTNYPNIKIPYGVLHSCDHFKESGEFTPMGEGYGFTCVTFVLQFLMDHGFFKIEWDTWSSDRSEESENL
jgi:hypothetical protein